MKTIFPAPIKKLPQADLSLKGAIAYLSQADAHQILFMRFDQEVELPEHRHGAQVGFVLSGRIDLKIAGEPVTFTAGQIYYIPEGVLHSGRIYQGYSDITFFDEPQRYTLKPVAEVD